MKLGEHSLDSEVDLIKDDTSFHIGVRLTLNAPDLDKARAQELLHKAHEVCPYSKATRGNVKVELAVARGKEQRDKRRDLQERDAQRQMERALKSRR